jgi:hypothetical protein
MLPPSLHTADSLMASLCREVAAIRQRASQLLAAMGSCQDSRLFQRLRQELQQLQERRRELLESARAWRRRGVGDALALEFLIEISSRPLAGSELRPA